jgi:Reverse transcriptase (RNA-dependent DNA polymerase)
VAPDEVAKQQSHLNAQQQRELKEPLHKFPVLFDGKLGFFPGRKVHLELKEGSVPVHKRSYPVPHAQEPVFKQELDRLEEVGVLTKIGASEWAAPSFIRIKKDGRVRWISDFRELNNCIKRKVYPLPRIMDILRRRNGCEFFTKLDISMKYYTFELDDQAKELCVIITPFGKYRYNRLPMGIKQSPDIAQEIMEDLLKDLKAIECYIDDVGVFNSSWNQHLKTLEIVLQRLQDNGFKINPLKCEWAVKETDWLGYWLTPRGLQPWKKKITAILKMSRPTTISEARSFIGAVSYYRDMFPQRSHILAPLTAIVGNKRPL